MADLTPSADVWSFLQAANNAAAITSLGAATAAQGALADTALQTSSLGTGVATFLGTPSSANLLAAMTVKTGTGSLVFGTSPTLVTPLLGTPTSGVLTNCTGLVLTSGVTGILPGANGGTGVANTGKTITLSANLLTTGTSGVTLAAPSTGSPIVYTLPTTAATLARTDAAQTFVGQQTFAAGSVGSPTINFPLGGGIYADATGVLVASASVLMMRFDYNAAVVPSNKPLGFSSTTTFGSYDVSLGRNAAGVLQVGTTGNNASGSLLLTNLTASGTLAVTGASTLTGVLTMSAVPRFNGTRQQLP
jgi:hypothetical protein